MSTTIIIAGIKFVTQIGPKRPNTLLDPQEQCVRYIYDTLKQQVQLAMPRTIISFYKTIITVHCTPIFSTQGSMYTERL